jgi:RNA polymerase primary sigma factor
MKLHPTYAGDDFVLELYLRDLSFDSQPRSNDEPEPSLSGDVEQCDRQHYVLGNLHRVVRIAADYQGRGVPLCDLINEGNIGLMRAAELFDPVRQVQFSHYASFWISALIKRALNYQARHVSLPADFAWRQGQVRGNEEQLAANLHREPDDAELAEASGLGLPAVRRLRTTPTPSFVPFETPCPGDEDGLSLAEILPDETVAAPDREAARQSDREFVETLVGNLTALEQRVIRLRFGLDDGCARTLEEIARLLGYVRQGIHRIESAALAKLRQHARFLQVTQTAFQE